MAKKNKNGGGPPRIVGDFSRYFGEDTLENWQRLCRDIGINKDLPNIKTCKKVRFLFPRLSLLIIPFLIFKDPTPSYIIVIYPSPLLT